MFIQDLEGYLINIKEDEQTRYQCEIWFDYTRKNMERIQEGAFLAAPNFFINEKENYRYTILEVVSVWPVHYGLGEDVKGYPSFVKEAARSAFGDWKQQESEAIEDTTQIQVIAVPTNLEVIDDDKEIEDSHNIGEESSLPMTGGIIRFINNDLTQKIANLKIDQESDNTIAIGHLIREKSIETYLLVEELLQVHFGIFGFTGSGKSNLLSTLVAKLFQEKTTQSPLKVVFFDLMSEYATLALDLLIEKDAYLIGLGQKTFPGEVIDYLAGQEDKLDSAAQAMANTSLLPRGIKKYNTKIIDVYKHLLENKKILIYEKSNSNQSLGKFVTEYKKNKMKTESHAQKDIKDDSPFKKLMNELTKNENSLSQVDHQEILDKIENAADQSGKEARSDLLKLKKDIDLKIQEVQDNLPLSPEVMISIPWIAGQLNNSDNDNLFVFQSHNPDELRLFSNWLGNATYEERRRKGQINPLVSFIFDEADEFIPQQPQGSYKDSTEIAMTLARRGRKFGLGIGIATQRITYLDTNILAQPHTYFVSKLPRKSDQEKIRDAFGISEEMFRQTIKFKKGDWLLVSYDATGLEAVPLPIHTPDANARLKKFLEQYDEDKF